MRIPFPLTCHKDRRLIKESPCENDLINLLGYYQYLEDLPRPCCPGRIDTSPEVSWVMDFSIIMLNKFYIYFDVSDLWWYYFHYISNYIALEVVLCLLNRSYISQISWWGDHHCSQCIYLFFIIFLFYIFLFVLIWYSFFLFYNRQWWLITMISWLIYFIRLYCIILSCSHSIHIFVSNMILI